MIILIGMCYNKLRLNTSYHCRYFFTGYAQKCIHDVPCGICEECVRDVQMDYFVRMKSEYEHCISNGGNVAFLTFTYSDDKIPAYSYHFDPELKDIVFDKINAKFSQLPFIYSFDRSNIQRFMNSYRKRFERMGVKSPFRYIVVGEYGTEEIFTQRSHFHVLFYYSKEAIELLKRYTPFTSIDYTILTTPRARARAQSRVRVRANTIAARRKAANSLDKMEECSNLVKAMTIISILLIFVGALMLPMK